MLGCGKEDNRPGSIYGTVTDKSTGDCVANAGVELMPKGLKTVTGSDGTFQFPDIEPGQYNLFITKVGYQDLKSNNIIVNAGDAVKGDVQIEKIPTSLQILFVANALSPVRILTLTPYSFNFLIAAPAEGFGGSKKAIIPMKVIFFSSSTP